MERLWYSPAAALGEFTMPEHQFVTLEDTPLIVLPRATPVRWSKSLISAMKWLPVLARFSRQRADHSAGALRLNETRPSQDKDDEQEVFYTPR